MGPLICLLVLMVDCSSHPEIIELKYVIIHIVTDDYVDHALARDILGTYTDVNLANEHVLRYFSNEYSTLQK